MNYGSLEKIIDLAAKDTQKGARVVAKAFYRVLRKKGFTENQIIDISTNVLNCLVGSLQGYEKKIENEAGGSQLEGQDKIPKEETLPGTTVRFGRRYDDYGNDQYNFFI
ncbi:MAG: hypothetical protein JSU90_10735 [Nitrospiraceae bacterium]|nr:MAG: hypothetical protein JSU90_10735 [Nitrospiraceae bacterium]